MPKPFKIIAIIFLILSLTALFISVIGLLFQTGTLKFQTAFATTADGFYALADSPSTLSNLNCQSNPPFNSVGYVFTPYTHCDSTYWSYDNVMVSKYAQIGGADTEITLPLTGISCGNNCYAYSKMTTTKDFKEDLFRAEIDTGYVSSGVLNKGRLNIYATDGITKVLLADNIISGTGGNPSVPYFSLLEITPSDLDQNTVTVSWGGIPLAPNNGKRDLSSLAHAYIIIQSAEEIFPYSASSSIYGGYATIRYPRYQLLAGCTLKPNQAFIAEYIGSGQKVGASVNSSTLGLKYVPAKFCFAPCANKFTIDGNIVAVKPINEICQRLITSQDYTVPDGISLIMYYPVDTEAHPELSKCKGMADYAVSTRTSNCIPFIMTGAGAYDPETGEWKAQVSSAITNTEIKTIQCTTDNDCNVPNLCTGGQFTCNTTINKCDMIKPCEPTILTNTEIITKTIQCTVDDDCDIPNICSGGIFICNHQTDKCDMIKPCDEKIVYGNVTQFVKDEGLVNDTTKPIQVVPLKEPVFTKISTWYWLALLIASFIGVIISLISIARKK